ncbi:hypothetical protein KCP75_02480 [Salmonella enterica subsp. enterica]|nr:hypothetical protein KCP75_02480 [Salmonella enterica subsp. enterica]
MLLRVFPGNGVVISAASRLRCPVFIGADHLCVPLKRRNEAPALFPARNQSCRRTNRQQIHLKPTAPPPACVLKSFTTRSIIAEETSVLPMCHVSLPHSDEMLEQEEVK